MLATGSFEDGMLATGSKHKPSEQPDPKLASKAPLTPDVTTIWYRAPEVLLEYDNYDTRVDMWAMGFICVELEAKHLQLHLNFQCSPAYSPRLAHTRRPLAAPHGRR